MFSRSHRHNHRQPSVAIVGSGNWWVFSDRVGPMVMQRLHGRYGPGVAIYDISTCAFALLECLHHQDLMVLVDACSKGGAPGEIFVTSPDLEAPLQDMPTLHQVGPVETLMVARHLYPQTLPKAISLVLIETEGLEEGALESVCQQAVSTVDQQIAPLFQGGPPTPEMGRAQAKSL